MDGCDGHDGGHDGALSLTVGHGVDHHGVDLVHGIAGGVGHHGLSLTTEHCAASHSFDTIHDATWGNATQNISPWNGVAEPELNVFRVHVVPHGPIDTKAAFALIAASMGFVKLNPPMVDQMVKGLSRTEQTLLPLSAWNPAVNRDATAAGHYVGATGSTELWRQFWQVGFKPSLLSTPIYDKHAMVYLEVVCITWCYREAGDNETLFAIRVVPRSYIDPVSNETGFRAGPLSVHRKAAGIAVKTVFDTVSQAPLHPAAKILRKRVMAAR